MGSFDIKKHLWAMLGRIAIAVALVTLRYWAFAPELLRRLFE